MLRINEQWRRYSPNLPQNEKVPFEEMLALIPFPFVTRNYSDNLSGPHQNAAVPMLLADFKLVSFVFRFV